MFHKGQSWGALTPVYGFVKGNLYQEGEQYMELLKTIGEKIFGIFFCIFLMFLLLSFLKYCPGGGGHNCNDPGECVPDEIEHPYR